MPDDHDRRNRESFQRQTRIFTAPNSPFARSAATTLAWVGELHDDLIVLDAACGAGHVAEQVAPQVRQVVGLDLTDDLLRIGAARLAAAGVSNVLFQRGNAAAMPFLDDSFDLVLCRSALHHFADCRASLQEMARVCRPGGRVAVLDMVPPDDALRDDFDHLHRLIDPSHHQVLTEDEMTDLLEELVGPVVSTEWGTSIRVPLSLMLNEGSEHEAALSRINGELDGGSPTGFAPIAEGEDITVHFTHVVKHAIAR
jgi:ubiquinone/menaquinone biosynthesis C-methylase UbiE